jgi:predicted RNA binding protein YcfA (HicA-like mRNA interferase family)
MVKKVSTYCSFLWYDQFRREGNNMTNLRDLKKMVAEYGWEYYPPNKKTSHGGFRNMEDGRKVVISIHGTTSRTVTKLERYIVNTILAEMGLKELQIKK